MQEQEPRLVDRRSTNGDRELQAALAHLARADACARAAHGSPWDFAVEIESLLAAGLTTSDLRALVVQGYAEHAQEMTRPRDAARRFQKCRNLGFARRTCFIVTEAGALLATGQGSLPALLPRDQSPSTIRTPMALADGVSDVPSWDRDRRMLCVGDRVVKQYRVPSPSQEAILAAFEEEGWPAAIDDPLPPLPEQTPQRRLRNTIQSLNANQQNHLLHFRGDGSGSRVLWELMDDRATRCAAKRRGFIRAA